ncbi:glycine oxidase ThiO [Haloechinothrix sp. LS1_15]|uniref:glycine oxidase ThiO n=1 Tax=Haloechinothrix sp. LS1_15 TaxID=2652248 RepID=UPI002945612B|nr:glycine oxidase ThiO [Haloechinothrix sp. LS1_15]MDV6014427.1 glycine oxidase ThiO [Haloechinothrix sp. LS1_15]
MAVRRNVAVVGGGVIGLSVAWRAAAHHDVTVYDPLPARGASWIAGGMLAPVTEAWPGEEEGLRLGEESLRRWPGFADELRAESFDPGLSTAGTVVAAADRTDAEQLEILASYLHGVGRRAELLTGRQLRSRVPGLATGVRRGLAVPSDLAVDTTKLLDALRAAARGRGVRFVPERVRQLSAQQVVTDDAVHAAEVVVLAAGAASSRLHPELAESIRPLKGEILHLRARKSSLPPPEVTVRAFVEGRPIYLVPREGGELVLGATQYEAGFDETVTAGGVRDLLDRAEYVFPSIVEYELVAARAGLRSASIDNVPLIGTLGDGVYVASGHHRNGLLLAPVTADAVSAMLAGQPLPEHVDAADPRRDLSGRERV